MVQRAQVRKLLPVTKKMPTEHLWKKNEKSDYLMLKRSNFCHHGAITQIILWYLIKIWSGAAVLGGMRQARSQILSALKSRRDRVESGSTTLGITQYFIFFFFFSFSVRARSQKGKKTRKKIQLFLCFYQSSTSLHPPQSSLIHRVYRKVPYALIGQYHSLKMKWGKKKPKKTMNHPCGRSHSSKMPINQI